MLNTGQNVIFSMGLTTMMTMASLGIVDGSMTVRRADAMLVLRSHEGLPAPPVFRVNLHGILRSVIWCS